MRATESSRFKCTSDTSVLHSEINIDKRFEKNSSENDTTFGTVAEPDVECNTGRNNKRVQFWLGNNPWPLLAFVHTERHSNKQTYRADTRVCAYVYAVCN